MAHTPGPWEISDQPEAPTIGVYANGDETIICDVMGEDVEPWEVVEANARLIAAAPDLLAACKAYQAAAERCSHSGRCNCLDEPGDQIRAAIAKAE